MRWREAADDSPSSGRQPELGLRELLEGPPSGEPRACGTLVRYAATLAGRGVREVAALDEAQLVELGLKPFHARRLQRWVAQLEETPEQEQLEERRLRGLPAADQDEIEAMTVRQLKEALDEQGISYHDCLEKEDLRERLLRGVPMSSATVAHTGPGLSEDQYSRAVVPVGDTVDGPAAVEARLDSRMDGVVDRGTLRSEGSNVSEMEEFLTPGATALEDEERLVDQLLELNMGFTRQQCEEAAMQAGGDLQMAVDLLIE